MATKLADIFSDSADKRVIILLCHGETASATPDRNTPLNDRGHTQAKELGGDLCGLPIDIIVHSGYQSARETVNDLLDAMKAIPVVQVSREILVVQDWRLRERDGEFTRSLSPEQHDRWSEGGALFARPPHGGESIADVCERVRSFMLDTSYCHVLIVTHPSVLLAFRCVIEQSTITGAEELLSTPCEYGTMILYKELDSNGRMVCYEYK